MKNIVSRRYADWKGRKGERVKERDRPPFSPSPLLPFSLSPRTPRVRRGFTLLEVILALAILAGAMAVLGEINRMALRSATGARDLARAQLLAETLVAEIKAGIASTDSAENQPFDTVTESLDPGEPRWLYSITSQSTDEDGVISVRITVTRDQSAGQHPVKFTLVRFMPDPNYTYTPPSSSTSTSTSGGN